MSSDHADLTSPARLFRNVLITNTVIANQTGSELYVRDIAYALRRRGFVPFLYTSRLGPLADSLIRDGFWVSDDLESLPSPPDFIHGQHHLETMTVLARFPCVPAVFFCHGVMPWQEAPPKHPMIRRYVAVSEWVAANMHDEHGITPDKIQVILNFVDTSRFHSRPPLPALPRRALVFSNLASEQNILPIIREACAQREIELSVAGRDSGQSCETPETMLPEYDIVFARGRSALEALAVGAAVICCDLEGLAGMCSTENIHKWRRGNLGIYLMEQSITVENILKEIDTYDPRDAAVLQAHIRDEASLEHAVETIIDVYQAVWQEAQSAPPPDAIEARRAMAHYMKNLLTDLEGQKGTALSQFMSQQMAMLKESHDLRQELDECRQQYAAISSSLSWRLLSRVISSSPVRWLYRFYRKG